MTAEYKEDQNTSPEDSPEGAKGYLYLAALMMAVAIAAYTLEGELYYMASSGSAFIMALVLPVLAALFFVYCYRNPRFGRKMMGHSVPSAAKNQKAGGLSYNIFRGESAGEEKLVQTKRKSARHLRKQLARATVEVAEEVAEEAEEEAEEKPAPESDDNAS